MERRTLGRTGLEVSLLTFGCGAVGGLMTKGAPADQDRAVAWARENGVNHFDTAPLYGNGASEENLGRALGSHRDGIVVSTKVRLGAGDLDDVEAAVRRSIEASLKRLKQDHVDLFQLHNTLGNARKGGDPVLSARFVLDHVVPAFEAVRAEGKTRFLGFTANGASEDCHGLIGSGAFDAAQIFYNLLVPTAGRAVPAGYPAQDYRQMLTAAKRAGVGSIGVRALAGGALSGLLERHPLGMAVGAPIGSDTDYATDVGRACAFQKLVDDGHAGSLPELAIRYVISNPQLSTTEIGIATLDEVKAAANAIARGPLPANVLAAIEGVQDGFIAA